MINVYIDRIDINAKNFINACTSKESIKTNKSKLTKIWKYFLKYIKYPLREKYTSRTIDHNA